MSPLKLVAAVSAAGALAAGSAVAVAAATGNNSTSSKSPQANVSPMSSYAATTKPSNGNCPNMGPDSGSSTTPNSNSSFAPPSSTL